MYQLCSCTESWKSRDIYAKFNVLFYSKHGFFITGVLRAANLIVIYAYASQNYRSLKWSSMSPLPRWGGNFSSFHCSVQCHNAAPKNRGEDLSSVITRSHWTLLTVSTGQFSWRLQKISSTITVGVAHWAQIEASVLVCLVRPPEGKVRYGCA